MLPEIGASELLVIAIVALIVVGPKDLPALLRKLGQLTAKVRHLAADFRASFDEMARQSELDDLRREVEAMRAGQAAAAQAISAPLSDVASEIDRGLSAEASVPPYHVSETASPGSPPPSEPRSEPAAELTSKPKPGRRRKPLEGDGQ